MKTEELLNHLPTEWDMFSEEDKIKFLKFVPTELIELERIKQVDEKGHTLESDDTKVLGELPTLACFYALPDDLFKFLVSHNKDVAGNIQHGTIIGKLLSEPVKYCNRENKERLKQLQVAGALIHAEMGRLIREILRKENKLDSGLTPEEE